MVYFVNETNLKHNFIFFPFSKQKESKLSMEQFYGSFTFLFWLNNALWILETFKITEKWSSTRPRTFLSLFWQFKVKHLTWFDVSAKVVSIWKLDFLLPFFSKKTHYFIIRFQNIYNFFHFHFQDMKSKYRRWSILGLSYMRIRIITFMP